MRVRFLPPLPYVNYGSDVFRAFLFISNAEVYLCDEDIWMTQASLAERFQTSIANIIMNIQNIYKESELMEEATSKPDLLVRNEGSRTVKRTIKVYNLIVNIIRSSCNRQERFIIVRARKTVSLLRLSCF